MRPRSLLPILSLTGLMATVAGGAAASADKVPALSVGAGIWDAATLVPARVADVTVFSDRARVRRRAHVAARAGINLIRFPDLTGAAFLDTLRLATSSGRVIRVESAPIERQRLDMAQAGKLLDELDQIADRITEVDERKTLDAWEVDFIGQLRPAPPVPEDKREGRKALTVDVGAWGRTLDFLTARGAAVRTRLVSLADERRLLEQRRDRVRADLRGLNQVASQERVIAVVGVLEISAAGAVDVDLEYFVPGAQWTPVYDLHASQARGQLRLETAALVQQTTGEDWDTAALSFSTAMPARGIDLPELLTWTLGERRDFVPVPRARTPPRSPDPPAPPITPVGESRATASEVIQQRVAEAIGGEDDAPEEASPKLELGKGNLRRQTMQKSVDRPAAAAPVAPPTTAFDALESLTVTSSAPRSYSESEAGSRRSRRPSSSEESWQDISSARTQTVPLALLDSSEPRRDAILTDPLLPAVSAGGLDLVYRAPTPASVPSTGKQIRIALDGRTYRTTAFYQATPALAATAFLRARVRNDGKRPLLRGPVAIFSDGEFVAQGELQTTGPSGDIELPLGADQDIRLVRQVVPRTQTTGIISRSDETTYDVQIQVGNYKKQSIVIEVSDQIPRSVRDKISVKLIATEPAPRAPPDADGIIRWRVELPAGATRTITLRYQITRPSGWMLNQQ